MDRLRQAAQSLDNQTVSLAPQLSSCPEYHDEALLWLAFYETKMNRYDRSAHRAGQVLQASDAADRFEILGQASEGNYLTLQTLIQSNHLSWKEDAEAILVWSRALMRDKKYVEARQSYDRYLSLKPDDIDIRIEAAYTYLWQSDAVGAEAKFKSLIALDSNMTESQQAAVVRGLELAQKQLLKFQSQWQGPIIPVSMERSWSSFNSFSKQGLRSGYRARSYFLDASVMNFKSDDETTAQVAGEIFASKNFGLGSETDLYLKLGWFQGEGGNALGAAVLAHSLGIGIKPFLGLETEPAVKTAPIPSEFTKWNQQALFVGVNFQDRFEYRFTSQSTSEQGNGAKNSFAATLPIVKRPSGDEFKFRLLVETLSTQKYSKFIYSPAESNTLLPGVFFKTEDATSQLTLDFSYGAVYEKLNPGDPSATPSLTQGSSGQLLAFGTFYKSKIEEDLILNLSFRYSRTASSGGTVSYQAGNLTAGIEWFLDSHQTEQKK